MRKREKSSKLKNKDLHNMRTKNDVLQDKERNIVKYEQNAIISSSYKGGKNENGEPDGRGIATTKNGDTYIGQWKEGRMEGQGLLYQDRINSKYFGNFENNLPEGKGKETIYSKKEKLFEWYEGGFSKGKRHGKGVIRDKNGYKYNVEYDHGRLIRKKIKQPDYRKHDDYSNDDNSDKEDKTTEVSNNGAKVNAKKKYRDIINLMRKNKSISNYDKPISSIRRRESIIIDEENIFNDGYKPRNNINDDNKKKGNFFHQASKHLQGNSYLVRDPSIHKYRKCCNKIKQCFFTHTKSGSFSELT